ncbi:heavy-metal-associated domain-containing protein [Paracoccus sp. S1E-3]|uniref:heavy-metal-associated domain-containing protein n=1 Tax=Paracoccus sp. S1E-3 TaxID=2756130 RepID=UPI0015EE925D|nr:heavy-metal-associated domain-containing protein [Paracoccus sp. S1E-3]MBA4491744.1 heavy-metal-associated domain-containing protein [Paracoccus sp. S1E-3]
MKLHVENMTCGGCAGAVSKTLTRLDENAKVSADPASRTVTVETSAAPAEVLKALDAAGFPAVAK